MSQINYLSQIVMGDMKDRANKNGGNVTPVMVDPATAIMIGKASIELVKTLKKCRKKGEDPLSPQEVRYLMEDPTEKKRVKKYIKKAVRRNIGMRKMFSKEAKEISQSIYNVSCNLSLKGTERLLEEVD